MTQDAQTTRTESSAAESSLPSPRGQAIWTGIYAVAMLYFGWYQLQTAPDQPLVAKIMLYTLRYGGVAMLATALFLATDMALAFAVDGVLGILAGIALAVVGLMLLMAKALPHGGVCLVFGYLFFTSGRRSMRDYRQLTAGPPEPPASTDEEPAAD